MGISSVSRAVQDLGAKPFQFEADGEAFGQQEPLTTRLRNLLQEYNEVQVLKEMLQNADDANATEVIFLLCEKSFETKRVFKKMDQYQGTLIPVCLTIQVLHCTSSTTELLPQRIFRTSNHSELRKRGKTRQKLESLVMVSAQVHNLSPVIYSISVPCD